MGTGALAWLLPAAALLAPVVGRGERFKVAARFTGMALASLAMSLLVARHLTGAFAPDVSTLLVPYAVAVAALVGTGVAAFEQDVASAQFGWRQVLSATAMFAVLLGAVPFIGATSSGRFDLPLRGFETQFGYLNQPRVGGTRTLWLGDPRALPLASWSIEPGLAFATSTNGLPGGVTAFVPPSSGAAHVLADDVVLAINDDTVHLGRLLAAAGIMTVIVVSATAPTLGGTQSAIATPPPAALLPALRHQQDLAATPGIGGVAAFVNDAGHGITAVRPEPLAEDADPGTLSGARGWTAALDPTTLSGPVPKGTLLASLAPAGDFTATVDGASVARQGAYGWAASWSVPSGTASISLDAWPLNALLASVVVAMWVVVAMLVIGLDRVARLRRRLRSPSHAAPSAPLDAAADSATDAAAVGAP
jgi:hypothetical protein